MAKKVLTALAALLAVLAVGLTVFQITVNLLAKHYDRAGRVMSIMALTGYDTEAVNFFLESLEALNIDLKNYTDAELAQAMTTGFVFKMTDNRFVRAKVI